jgi:hypothetical protein
MCVSYRRLRGVFCGHALFSRRPFRPDKHDTREPPRTRSPDTPAPRLSFDLFWGSPRRLPGLGTRLARSLQTSVRSVSRTNERTFFLACELGPNLPSAVFLSRAFLQTAQDLEEVTSHRSEFSLASFRLASPRLESPPPYYRSWRCFEAGPR